MSSQTLTLSVPDPLYQRLKRRAAQTQRSVEEEMLDALVSAVPEANGLSDDLESALSSLALLDDTALWRAARSHLASEAAEEIEGLHLKRQREGLTDAETQSLTTLMAQYERAMLVRAQAAAILRQRGHSVSALVSPS
jgi:plasmid stability protein